MISGKVQCCPAQELQTERRRLQVSRRRSRQDAREAATCSLQSIAQGVHTPFVAIVLRMSM